MDQILVGTRKGLFFVARAKAGWTVARTAFLGDHVPMAHRDPESGTVWAVLEHGHFGTKLHRSADEGATWEECAAPAYPEDVQKENWEIPIFGKVPMALEKIWALESIGGELWCGTIPGGLFVSRDRGTSWELVRGLWDHPARKKWGGGGARYPGIHSIEADPRDPRRIYVGVSTGGVWLTEDGGKTWSPRCQGLRADYFPPEQAGLPESQDVHRVVLCRARPETLWLQHHNGIFRSADGGRNWTELKGSPSSFGFAVAVHPEEPDTAWFVPAVKDEKRYPVDGKVVVSRTRDGGKTFEVLREGLPQEHAYDLVYRHGLAIDSTGKKLAFGSTTGSLWVTENRGDAWTCVSTHLPPIYVVRFA